MKTILIAAGDPNFNFYNRKNVLATCLISIKKQLESKGYEVHLSNEDTFSDNAKVNKSSILKGIKRLVQVLLPNVYYALLDWSRIRGVRRIEDQLLERHKPDLVLELLELGSTIGYKFKERYNVPYIIICDSPLLEKYKDFYTHPSLVSRTFRRCEKVSLEHADHIFFYSDSVRDYLKSEYSINCQTAILPIIDWEKMVEMPRNNTDEDIVRISFIGSFLKWHKVDLLVRVFDKLWQDNKNIELLLIGYGQQWDLINETVQHLDCRGSIVLTGFIDNEELEQYKAISDIGVMPGTNWYGAPLKIFEYAMLNIPVIAPNSPTINDLFNNEEILVIDSSDEFQSLYNHLSRLINSLEERELFAQKLNSSVKKRFDKNSYFNTVERVINSIS